jgi:hypothetical protein
MTTLILIVAASVVLNCGIAYAAWVNLRAMRLKADLLDILADLRGQAIGRRWLYDPAFVVAWKGFVQSEEQAGSFSLAAFVYLMAQIMSGECEPEPDGPESADQELMTAIRTTRGAIVRRITRFLLNETLSGWLCRLVLIALPQQITRQQVRRTVEFTLPGRFTRPYAYG